MSTNLENLSVSRRRQAIIYLFGGFAILKASLVFGGLVDDRSSKIQFTAKQSEVAVDGKFLKFVADVDFDPTVPAAGRVDLVIDLASVSTGSTEADELLKGKEFFDVAHFPQASFSAKSINATGANHFQAPGKCTLKGRSTAIIVPFTARTEGVGLRIEGRLQLSRLAYHVGEGLWADTGTLDDQVQILFSLYLPR
jgi:polyisoprenoid-binding protein YceI